MDIQLEQIQSMIYVIRDQRVMLDSDLANLYGVDTKRLNEQVRRNSERFPVDFMFQLTTEEYEILRSQIATSSEKHGGRRYQPLVFTENGVAMLSTVLNSKRAIQVNITIMRIFTKLRSFLLMEQNIESRMDTLENGTNQLFKIVFERLDNLEQKLPSHDSDRKKIGLKGKGSG